MAGKEPSNTIRKYLRRRARRAARACDDLMRRAERIRLDTGGRSPVINRQVERAQRHLAEAGEALRLVERHI